MGCFGSQSEELAKRLITSSVLIDVLNKTTSVDSTVDTGCSWTLASSELLLDLGLDEKDLETSGKRIVMANSQQTKLLGSKEVRITLGDWVFDHKLEFCKDLPVKLLIGLDILNKIGPVVIDSKARSMYDKNGVVLLGADNSEVQVENGVKSEELEIPDKIFENSIFTETQKEEIRSLIREFTDIWVSNNRDALCTLFEGTIPMKRGFEDPVYIPPRKIPIHHMDETRAIIQQWLDDKKIEPCQSAFNCNLMVVPKPLKPGQTKPSLRPVIDFRPVNRNIASDPVIVDRATDLRIETKPNKYRSTFDFPSAYMQIGIKKSDRHRTAFTFDNQQYQFTVFPFGLKTSGARLLGS